MIVSVESVKNYGPRRAVDRLRFEIRAGETFALFARNGAGKSTTLSMLVGLSRPDQGAVRIVAEDPSQPNVCGMWGVR